MPSPSKSTSSTRTPMKSQRSRRDLRTPMNTLPSPWSKSKRNCKKLRRREKKSSSLTTSSTRDTEPMREELPSNKTTPRRSRSRSRETTVMPSKRETSSSMTSWENSKITTPRLKKSEQSSRLKLRRRLRPKRRESNKNLMLPKLRERWDLNKSKMLPNSQPRRRAFTCWTLKMLLQLSSEMCEKLWGK